MLGSLVQTITSDGVRLHGFLTETEHLRDAWILVHGVNSNFYASQLLLELGQELASEDTAILLVNTRGHDILSFNSGPTPMRVGSQIEKVSASQLDLDAWVQFLRNRGVQSVSLLGHSLGAIKCILASVKSGERWKSLVAVSPPRLNTELLSNDSKRGAVFREHLEEAAARCDAGFPEYVMKVRFPLPMWVCAATYLDKYGSGEQYDYLAMANKLCVPTLWTFGQFEVESDSANFKDADKVLQEKLACQPLFFERHRVSVVHNADHSYRDVTTELAAVIRNWSNQLMKGDSSS